MQITICFKFLVFHYTAVVICTIKLLLPKYLIKATVKETKTINAMALTAHSQNFEANNKLLQTITISLFKYLP